MASCCGFDEVGLGPILGPMVLVSCGWQGELAHQTTPAAEFLGGDSVRGELPGWQFPAPPARQDCGLSRISPLAAALDHCGRKSVESKQLYRCPARDFGRLELWALALAGAQLGVVTNVAHLLTALFDEESLLSLRELPWYADLFSWALPVHPLPDLEALTACLAAALARWELQLRYAGRLLTSARLNQRYAKGENRAAVHAAAMSTLLAERQESCLLVDRWGGRKFYLPTLRGLHPHWQVLCEGARLSSYSHGDRCCHFLVAADVQHAEVAAASLLAKYVRELCMLAFNRYWQRCCPGLPLTSGYPLDAERWWTALVRLSPKFALCYRAQLRRQR